VTTSGPTFHLTIKGALGVQRAMGVAPKVIRARMVKAMRIAAQPAKARAEASVHWSGAVQIRATRTGARVGTSKLVPPIIEFGNKAVIGSGGKVAPHVRKLHRHPALIDAVEGTAPLAARIAEREVEVLMRELLTTYGATIL
jgi:hypothetical protein